MEDENEIQRYTEVNEDLAEDRKLEVKKMEENIANETDDTE